MGILLPVFVHILNQITVNSRHFGLLRVVIIGFAEIPVDIHRLPLLLHSFGKRRQSRFFLIRVGLFRWMGFSLRMSLRSRGIL